MNIPKYIISASGDDFFVPDSLNLYLSKLPGENRIRVVPNQGHYMDLNIVEDAMLAYYQAMVEKIHRPSLKWKVNAEGKLGEIITNEKPVSVKLWEAENPDARDFRFRSHINYVAKELTGRCLNHECQYQISIIPPAKGWKANFAEVTFQHKNMEPMTLTTPVYIIKNSP